VRVEIIVSLVTGLVVIPEARGLVIKKPKDLSPREGEDRGGGGCVDRSTCVYVSEDHGENVGTLPTLRSDVL
jgi:hypothetical protein